MLRPELAVNAGITGPMLRGSGVNYDIRKVDHYGIYDRFKFRVPLGDHGDIYDRYMVRMLEMRESIRDSGAGAEGYSRRAGDGSQGEDSRIQAQAGRGVWTDRGPKGELGFLSDQRWGPNPYRYRVRPPSLINLTVLEDMCLGHNVADVVLIFGSVDIVLGEVDR